MDIMHLWVGITVLDIVEFCLLKWDENAGVGVGFRFKFEPVGQWRPELYHIPVYHEFTFKCDIDPLF
jgi:hypothetical protein